MTLQPDALFRPYTKPTAHGPAPRRPRTQCSTALSLALFAAAVLLTLGGCAKQSTASASSDHALTGTLELTGSSTVAPLVAEIGKRFETAHPAVRINVQTGGSSRGIADAGNGLADIGMSSRDLKASEATGKTTWTLAVDGVAFIVHADNPVDSLSRRQLLDIFTGRLNDWRQVGGTPGEIVVINRAAGRSELELVSKFFGVSAADLTADLIAGENQQGLKMVANDVRAITYLSVGASEYEVSQGTPIKLLPLDGIAATVDNVAAGRFPLARPLILITPPETTPLTQSFIDFAMSPEVHDLVRQLSYVPVDS